MFNLTFFVMFNLAQTLASAIRLSPSLFGEPTSRSRAWRIMYDPSRMMWNCIYTFSELTKIFLLPTGSELRVGPTIFLTAGQSEIESGSRKLADLSPSESLHLGMFKQTCPTKVFYDLGSNPNHRRRTESNTGALMTLTTNTHIWWPGR